MKKEDLKSGMWIECMNHNRYLLMNSASDEELWGFRYEGKIRLSDYMDDLTFKTDEWSIRRVWHYDNPMDTSDIDFGTHCLIWERSSHKKDMEIKIEKLQEQIDKLKEDLKK